MINPEYRSIAYVVLVTVNGRSENPVCLKTSQDARRHCEELYQAMSERQDIHQVSITAIAKFSKTNHSEEQSIAFFKGMLLR